MFLKRFYLLSTLFISAFGKISFSFSNRQWSSIFFNFVFENFKVNNCKLQSSYVNPMTMIFHWVLGKCLPATPSVILHPCTCGYANGKIWLQIIPRWVILKFLQPENKTKVPIVVWPRMMLVSLPVKLHGSRCGTSMDFLLINAISSSMSTNQMP